MKSRFETYGDLSWCELLTADIEGAKQFYKEVLGWGMEQMPMEGEPYTVIRAGDRQVAGIMRMPEQVPAGTPPHWEAYITVDDVDAVARKVEENGGRILVPYFNLFFKQTFAVSDGLLRTLFAGQSMAIGIATLTGPLVAARWGKIRAVAATQLASVPFLLLLGCSNFLTVAAIGFLAHAALMNMGGSLYSAFAMERIALRRAAMNGILTMSWSGSFALRNWISGQPLAVDARSPTV